jgi:hypothetical protein
MPESWNGLYGLIWDTSAICWKYDEVFGFVVSLWQAGGTDWTWHGAVWGADTKIYALREW